MILYSLTSVRHRAQKQSLRNLPSPLNRRWIQHDSDRCPKRLGRQIAPELCSYYARVACFSSSAVALCIRSTRHESRTMRPCNLSPDDPYLRPADLFVRTVNKSNLLAQVEAGCESARMVPKAPHNFQSVRSCFGIVDAFNFDQTGSPSTLVSFP